MSLNNWLQERGLSNCTIVTPDLDWCWYKVCLTKALSEFTLPYSSVDDILCHPRSVVRLLLTPELYTSNENYLYMYNTDNSNNIPSSYLYKLHVIKNYVVLKPSETNDSVNLWELDNEELDMLDRLFEYVQTNDTVLVDFSTLNSYLSKLIHCYLNFKLNNDFSRLNDLRISDNRLLVYMYDIYLRLTVYKELLGQ